MAEELKLSRSCIIWVATLTFTGDTKVVLTWTKAWRPQPPFLLAAAHPVMHSGLGGRRERGLSASSILQLEDAPQQAMLVLCSCTLV